MADHHPHHDPIEDNIDTHPVKVAIGVAIGAVALIIGIMMLADFAVGSYGLAFHEGRSVHDARGRGQAPRARGEVRARSECSAARRRACGRGPRDDRCGRERSCPCRQGRSGGAGDGKKTYETVCFACHGAGVAGAPKFGDKAAWAPRVARGKDALHASALKGKGAMPPKGGNPALSDADVAAAVDYMVAAAK